MRKAQTFEARLTNRFFLDLPVTSDFAALAGPGPYRPLPDDWLLCLADVAGVDAALAAGRYRSVNMAGAAALVALMNALESMTIPFVFCGDGVRFAVHADQAGLAGEALARAGAFVRDEFGLALLAAMVPVAAIRAAGRDVQVARFAASSDVSYAMFRGGGLAFAAEAMAAGAHGVKAAPEGYRPDLAGLSCRFDESPARNGVMLSLLVQPTGEETPEFDTLVRDILALAADGAEAVRPFAGPESLSLKRQAEAFDLEARTYHVEGYPRWLVRLERQVFTRFVGFLLKGDRGAGRFDAGRYKREVIANADYRGFAGYLRLTLDCTPALADAMEARLKAARAAGTAHFGLSRQKAAIMTCVTPTLTDPDHIHFIDGAGGGYALAARALKGARGGSERLKPG